MKHIMLAMMFMMSLTSYAQVKQETGKHVILPSSKLLKCVSFDCSQLWQDKPPDPNDIYPKQVVVDLLKNDYCPTGVMAHYDKSVSIEVLKAAVDERYGKWAMPEFKTGPVMLWRVESEKFVISVSTVDKQEEERDGLEPGTKTVIYLSFQPTKCGSQ
jgi:hypothetical protein